MTTDPGSNANLELLRSRSPGAPNVFGESLFDYRQHRRRVEKPNVVVILTDDLGWQGDVKLSKAWSLEIEQDGKWKLCQLYTTDRFDTRANQFNVIHPAAPTECDTIRIIPLPEEITNFFPTRCQAQ